MKKCRAKCRELHVSCPVKECRYWILSESDLNCTFEAISNNEEKGMTLREIGDRLELSHVMISFIETCAIEKLKSKADKNSFSQ